MKARGRGKKKRNNILSVLSNIKSSLFDGVYLNYFDKQSKSEESIAERTKLRRQGFNEIAEREKMIDPKLFRECFGYSSPSVMYKNLNNTISTEENKAQVNMIKNSVVNLMEEFESNPKSDTKKLETEITCQIL